ncbi:MAG: endolytic transglycosylase MltG [Sporomusaceae bacterium]|nr:endolytic transglycosylase MltG [Sporomusaceae bacterium]
MLQIDKQMQKWLILLIIAGVFAILAGSAVYSFAKPVNAAAGDAVMVVVKPGMTTQAIGELLYEKGLIKNVLLFRIVAKLEGAEGSLKAGEYALSKAMTVNEMIGKLTRGETAYKQFTIPEGFTIDQIAAFLEKNNLASAAKYKTFAAGYAPYDYINPAANAKYKAEGFVFPDTYRIAAGTNEEQLVKMMMSQFDSQFTPAMRQRAAELGLSVREVVILASLVEKEAQVAAERPVIAGVFMRRLKLEMPLQSCATIQYILGYPKPELTVQDTELPSPYNTYQNMGLPPGPIASPGLAAIKAVLNPADTDYLYFFANKDGSHVFSRTYDEHLAAINRDGN